MPCPAPGEPCLYLVGCSRAGDGVSSAVPAATTEVSLQKTLLQLLLSAGVRVSRNNKIPRKKQHALHPAPTEWWK